VRTLAVANQKGGSGKTTCAVNLGAALAELGQRVLLVDLDAQASASSWLGVQDGGRGLLEVFTANGNLTDLVRATDVPGLELVPASAWLVGLEKALAGEVGAESILRRALGRLPRNRWDFVLLDTPPTLGLLSLSALVAGEELLVPVGSSTLELGGLAALVETTERVRERLNPRLRLGAVLLCRTDTRTRLAREVEASVRERFGARVLRATVPESVRLREAWSHGAPITRYAPTSSAAAAYRAAARELLDSKPAATRAAKRKA
jgi:chromosome partitioning protein